MKLRIAEVYRYANGPAALVYVALIMHERGEVYGMQCASGHPMYARISRLQPASAVDRATWADHEAFRVPYRAHFDNLIIQGNPMDDISIDCETLSTRPNAAVLSIGAVQFNRDTGKIGKKLHLYVDIEDAIKHGHVGASTIAWWIAGGDKEESATDLFGGLVNTGDDIDSAGNQKLNVHAALCQLKAFIGTCSPNPRVWGNGATADITWLESAFASAGAGMDLPWHFTNIRDMRTTIDDADLDLSTVKEVKGPRHNALVDAEWQANAISAARKKIRAALKSINPVVEDDDEL